MKKISHFMLSDHTNKLYTKEAISSISLTRDVADKINELVDAYNHLIDEDLTWKHEQEGRIRKGVIYMKDNLINSIHDLLKLYMNEEEIKTLIAEIIDGDLNNIFSRLENVCSVTECGAKGDGINDDTEAIQKALYSGSSVVYFPKGTYRISSIEIPSDVTLTGDGYDSIILQNKYARDHMLHSSNFNNYKDGAYRNTTDGCVKNVRIEKLYLKGSKLPDLNAIALYGFNITLHDLEISSFGGLGIHLESPGSIHSSPTQNLQNDIYNITVSHCIGGNIYYNGQSDSVFNNVLAYYGGQNEGYSNAKNVVLGDKAHGCKFNGMHLWGECDTHLTINGVGCTFTNLHAEGAYTQIEINNRFTTMTAVIYDPIHTDGGSTGFKFGELAGNFLAQISCRNIETVFDYQGYSPYGHNITAHVSQNIDGVLFTNYPTAPFINIQWYKNGEYKWETVTPWGTLKDTWSNFNTKTAPTFEVNNERVFGTVNNGSPTSYINIENGNSARGPKLKVSGTEENADFQLEARGDGKIRFGTYNEATGSIAGYIEIKDSSGTIRKLACLS